MAEKLLKCKNVRLTQAQLEDSEMAKKLATYIKNHSPCSVLELVREFGISVSRINVCLGYEPHIYETDNKRLAYNDYW